MKTMKQWLRRCVSAVMGVCVMATLILPATPGLSFLVSAAGDTNGVTVNNIRVQALSETIVRVEWKGPKGFEDRETYNICNREFTLLPTTVTVQGNETVVTTDYYTVYVPQNATSLEGVRVTNPNGRTLWTYEGMPSSREYLPDPGDTPEAYAIADTPRIVPASWGAAPSPNGKEEGDLNGWDVDNDAPDLYVLLPNQNYRTLMKDFITLTGSAEMIPLKAFGLWYSKYSNISQDDALQDIDDFRDHNFPLDYFGVDTDWRVGGREGYELNTSKWPDLEGFLETAHTDKNVMVYFNDHAKPHTGQMFDDNALTSGSSALAWDELNYRLENLSSYLNLGLDMWWVDRNWPYFVLSPFETMGISRDNFGMYIYQSVQQQVYPLRRPMIMGNVDGVDSGIVARAANLTSHRYSVQWTGDTMCYMSSLSEDIASMVNMGVLSGIPYVTHDNGGHAGTQNGASYLRWVQFGVFSPVMRFHSSGTDTDRAPWLYSGAEDTAREYINLRYRLLPVYYSLAHENYTTGLPILRRLDIDYPGYAESQDDSQYLLGENILVAPMTDYSETGTKSRSVFLPDGTWINLFTGESFVGPKTITVSCDKNTMPLFVRGGSILPTVEEVSYIGEKDWSKVALDVYPSTVQEGTFTFYEDDTETVKYKDGAYRETLLSTGYDQQSKKVTVNIGKAEGTFDGADKFDTRTWTVRLHAPAGWGSVTGVTLNGSPVTVTKINKVSGSYPLKGAGMAAVDDVYEVTFSAKLNTASALQVTYSSVPTETAVLKNTDAVSMTHKVNTALPEENVSSLSPVDSLTFSSASVPSGSTSFRNVTATEKKDFQGTSKVNGTDVGLGIGNGTLSFDVDLSKGDSYLTLYMGHDKASSSITVTDGSDVHVKIIETENLSGLRQDKVTVHFYAEKATTVHVSVKKTGGEGKVGVYAAALSKTDPGKAPAITYTSFRSEAPTSVNFSASSVDDWVHVGYGGSAKTVTRKKGVNLLSDPIVVGNTSALGTYATAISFGGSADGTSADGIKQAVNFENSVEFTVPASKTLRELKVYTGTRYATNTVEIWDEAGSPVQSYQMSHNSNRYDCITIQYSAEEETTLHVRLRRTYGRTGNGMLAGYTLSEITEADLLTGELRALLDVYKGTYSMANLKPYTENSVQNYLKALTAAKAVSRKDPVTQDEVDTAMANLKAAVKALAKNTGTDGTDLIPADAVATASGQSSTSNTADKAIDDNRDGTRWAAQSGGSGTTDWLCVDLKKATTFDRVSLYWESVSHNYSIQVSDDGTTWTTVATDSTRTERAGTRITTDLYFDTVTARYVRMHSTARSTDAFGGAYLSVLEMSVYYTGMDVEETLWDKLAYAVDNPVADLDAYSETTAKAYQKAIDKANLLFDRGETDENVLQAAWDAIVKAEQNLVEKEYNATAGATATATQSSDSRYPVELAIDGNTSTRWASSNGGATQSITVDMKKVHTVSRLALYWESASNAYTVELSEDGQTWQTVVTNTQSVSAGTGTVNRHEITPTKARYVRLTSTKGAPGLGTYLSLYEMEVYALTPSALLGDVDEDGWVSASDLTALARHVGGVQSITSNTALLNADINRNGNVDSTDLTKLARIAAGIDNAGGGENQVVAYDLQDCHSRSELATMKVNGKDVPIIAFTDYDFGQFDFSGKATIQLTVADNVEYFSISPLAKNIKGTADGKTLTFTITESTYMIVKINGLKEICIAADDIETDVPASSGVGIYNIVSDYGADATGETSAVAALNQAVTDANAAGGGTVYVPSGLYKMDGNVVLKSNVNLYLAPGSVLRSVEDRANYLITAYKSSLSKDVTWMFYNELGAENIKIYGRGMIDVNGYARLHGEAQLLDTPLYFRQAKNITVDGITVFDGNFWTVEPKLCEDCTFTNLKVINAFTGFTENDAIDICESKNVLVQHMFAISEDDTYSTKCYGTTGKINNPDAGVVETDVYESMGFTQTLDNVTFDDCFGWTHCGTFKVGDGSVFDQSNVTFKNSYSYKCMQAIKVSRPYANGDYKDITYDNIDIEGYGGRVSYERRWLYISTYCQGANGGTAASASDPGNIDGLTIKNINIRDLGVGSCINGAENCYVKDLVFENITVPYMDEYASTLEEMDAATNVNANGISDYKIYPVDNTVDNSDSNLALSQNGTTATSSAVKSDERGAAQAIDGNESTNWCANANDSSVYLQLDFGKTVTVEQVVLTWNQTTNCAVDFDLLYSTDGTTWTTLKEVRGNAATGKNTIDTDAVTARYLKYVHVTGGTYAPCLKEVEVYGGEQTMTAKELDMARRLSYMNYPESKLASCSAETVLVLREARETARKVAAGEMAGDIQQTYDALVAAEKGLKGAQMPDNATNLALNKTVTASGQQNNTSLPSYATDGNPSSCWRSQMTGSTSYWITVDLGSQQEFDSVVLSWEDCYARIYKLAYSDDGENWTNITVAGDDVLRNQAKCVQTVTVDGTISARYVRMTCFEKATGYGVGVYEFGVYKLK